MVDEGRVSDLKAFGEIVGKHPGLHAWPPAERAPGVELRRRAVTVRDPKTQEPREVRTYLEPVVVDAPAYYANLHARNTPGAWSRRKDRDACPRCNGANFVRYGELTPGRPGFGTVTVCPNYVSLAAGVGHCVFPAD